ncbi:hypothetical protein [Deinococcus sp. RM]|uniref:hypothetical protein n=1 Tax=Deinococcus sp. RM TaxID=2316359 RepID=UPI001314C0E9|nr:hypothetical protein [Deinococcus sp. RM]
MNFRTGCLPGLLLSGGVGLVGTFALLPAVMTGFNVGYTSALDRHHGQVATVVAGLCAGLQLLIIGVFAFLGWVWPPVTRRAAGGPGWGAGPGGPGGGGVAG